MARRQPALSLFWRTFVLLLVLLVGGVFAWTQTFRALEFEPRAVQAAQQIASLVNLSRVALSGPDAISRLTIIKAASADAAVKFAPREPGDRWKPYEVDRFSRAIAAELRSRLGADTVVASELNGVAGLWVGFQIDDDAYWLQADPTRLGSMATSTLLIWVGIALAITVFGALAIATAITKPLRELSFTASRIREGEFDSRLDENTLTSEIRQVNMGFNRMARELAKLEDDRAVMLAGISHDLRTPLARLRLEAEMSVHDEEALNNMALDIDQLDAIIDKFMDYSRPGDVRLASISLAAVIDRESAAFRDPSGIKITSKVPDTVTVIADETELGRVLQNLFENARRYGRSTDDDTAHVDVTCAPEGPWLKLIVRDHGPGIAIEKLAKLTTPFYRGDAARTAATGAGLGLAIVEKAIQRMGGALNFDLASDGGFVVQITLKRPL